MTSEAGLDLSAPGLLDFLPDLPLSNAAGDTDFPAIQSGIDAVLAARSKPLLIGGDHSVSLPALRAFAARDIQPVILHFDAHPDLYDRFDGSPWSHACPFSRILEEGLATRLIQIGVRTANAHQRDQIERFGVECYEMKALPDRLPIEASETVYISFDMDALDPSIAPGVSHLEPGGLSMRQALGFLQQIRGPVVGADIVEFNPDCDPSGMTASAVLKLVKEIGGLLAR